MKNSKYPLCYCCYLGLCSQKIDLHTATANNLTQYIMERNFIATMTVSEFIGALVAEGLVIVKKEEPKAKSPEAPESLDFSDSSRYGCGLRAIRDRYKVSNLTAQRLKDGLLAPAVFQGTRGGKFWVDFVKADELMKQRKPKRKTENAQTITA